MFFSIFKDRLIGLVAITSRAFHFNLPIKIRWKNLGLGFELTQHILQDNSTYYAKMIDSSKSLYRKKCKEKEYYHCKSYHTEDTECPLYLRACVGRRQCIDLKESLEKADLVPSMKHVVGCPLRTLLQPSQPLLTHEVNVFFLGSLHTIRLQTLFEYLQRFRVISVHLRMGDFAFLKGSDDEKLLPIKMSSLKCLDQVEDEIKYDRRPIVWYIATDDYKLKQFFMARFPKRTITLTRKAHHLSFVTKQAVEERELETKDLFADWMLIGRGQELITNHAHNFGVSSFSRLSWLYHLKDQYYELSSNDATDEKLPACSRKMFEYDGNLGQLDKTCLFGY